MVQMNGKEISSNAEPILMAVDDVNTNEGKEKMEQEQTTKTARQQRDARLLKEFMRENEMDADDIKKLLKEVQNEDDSRTEQAPTNLSEEDDAAVNYLLSGGRSDSVDDAAVDQLLAFNKKRVSDG